MSTLYGTAKPALNETRGAVVAIRSSSEFFAQMTKPALKPISRKPATPTKAKPEPKTIALTPETLQRLGGVRLAELVLELSENDAPFKRRLKLELSGPQGAAHAVGKRLATLAKSKSYIEWHKVKGVHDELVDQRTAIVERIAPTETGMALDLLWQLTALAGPLLDRSFDGNGVLVTFFVESVVMLADVANAAKPPLGVLASQVMKAALGDDYGVYDDIVALMAPTMGDEGLTLLKDLMVTVQRAAVPKREAARHLGVCQRVLRDIADARGDVDAFIESYVTQEPLSRHALVQIAERLLKAGRAEEALAFLDRHLADDTARTPDWQRVRADVLEALGRQADAQAFRLACFRASLNADLLRAYIKRLPDFDDEEALDAALLYAQGYSPPIAAVSFLMNWPSYKHAAARIVADADRLSGNDYVWLTELGKALDEKYPLAATLVRRAMVRYTLSHAKAKRYKYAARHIKECQVSAAHIEDWHSHPDHDIWLAMMVAEYPRKFGVWDLV